MKALADAIVYAVTYINCLPDPTEEHLDEDVHALENIATYLHAATEVEKDALAVAAQKAFALEQTGLKREDYLRAYGFWMEDTFVEGWEGNTRINGPTPS